MRILKNKWFNKFALKEKITDLVLRQTVEDIERGKIDADLGEGVIKQRIARPGQGKSGGYRSIILYRKGDRAFFVYGFAKKDEANISVNDEKAFKRSAEVLINLSDEDLREQIEAGNFLEVKDEENV